MKQYILPSLLSLTICMASCKDKTADESKDKSAEAKVDLPMPVAYQGKAEIGSTDNTIKVMNWNKLLGSGKIDSALAMLADSVTIRLSGGKVYNTTADSIKPIIKGYFSSVSSANIQYVAVLPINVKVSDTNTDQWVLSWTDESYVLKDGKTEHSIIHEDYRLVNGKIREVNQYGRKVDDAPTANSAPGKK